MPINDKQDQWTSTAAEWDKYIDDSWAPMRDKIILDAFNEEAEQ